MVAKRILLETSISKSGRMMFGSVMVLSFTIPDELQRTNGRRIGASNAAPSAV